MASKTKSCLLIESDPEDQEFFLNTISDVASDVGCYAVSDGEEALFTLFKEDFKPDYIFTALTMPRMNGLEFIKVLKGIEKFRHIPVIVYTFAYSEDHIHKVTKLGATAIYSKARMGVLKDILKKYL
ncbi:response regulator [Chryseosolibacter indicus]|uniref:Response regulator n=1 Tax=Chryseosolibacter indicus TaxID=2782351 RepID=A0ABS5VXP9_9BACT|nr:response regulator [Chryseosolibacter indicus]MBT1706173.1 response regulator [Chryseosolibacter indicus]